MIQLAQDLQQNDLKTMYKNQGITYLGLFGSFARGEETQESDVDLLIDFDSTKSLFDLADIKLYFKEKLGRPVDMAMRGQIKDSLQAYINKDLIAVYEEN